MVEHRNSPKSFTICAGEERNSQTLWIRHTFICEGCNAFVRLLERPSNTASLWNLTRSRLGQNKAGQFDAAYVIQFTEEDPNEKPSEGRIYETKLSCTCPRTKIVLLLRLWTSYSLKAKRTTRQIVIKYLAILEKRISPVAEPSGAIYAQSPSAFISQVPSRNLTCFAR